MLKSSLVILMMASFCVAGCGNISGIITVNDVPFEGVEVVLSNSSGVTVGSVATDRDGVYSFSSISPGSYTVIPNLAHHVFSPRSIPVEAVSFESIEGIDYEASLSSIF